MKLRSRHDGLLILLQAILALSLGIWALGKGIGILWLCAVMGFLGFAFIRAWSFRRFVQKKWRIEKKVIPLRVHSVNWTFVFLIVAGAFKAFTEGGNEIVGLGFLSGWIVGDFLIKRYVEGAYPKKLIFDEDNNLHYLSETYFFVPLEGATDVKLNFNNTRLKFKTASGKWKKIPIESIGKAPEVMSIFLQELYTRLDLHAGNKLYQELFPGYMARTEIPPQEISGQKDENPHDLFKDFLK